MRVRMSRNRLLLGVAFLGLAALAIFCGHQGSLSLRAGGARMEGGASLVMVGRRADSDFAGLGLMDNPGYTRLDLRLRARLGRGLQAFLVGENVFDRRYQEVLGYPALGRCGRASCAARSDRNRRISRSSASDLLSAPALMVSII